MVQNSDSDKNIQISADTLKVVLPSGQFEICPTNKLHRWAGISIATASRQDKIDGFYRPKAKINHWTEALTIEFSPAKLIYGNNLQLVTLKDFQSVLEILQAQLNDYGIETTITALAKARLHRLDIGYNIYLPKKVPVISILQALNGCLTSGHKRQFRIQYENGGTSLRIGTASVDLLLYDKLQAPETIGGVDYINQQPLKEILRNTDCNILRIEKRFTTRKEVKKIFALYGISNPVLADICHHTMGQNIIFTEWKSLLDSCCRPTQSEEDLLTQLILFLQCNPQASPKQGLVYLAIQQMLEHHSFGDIREQLFRYSSYQTVRNLFDEVKRWKIPHHILAHKWLDQITEVLVLWPSTEPSSLELSNQENSAEGENIMNNEK